MPRERNLQVTIDAHFDDPFEDDVDWEAFRRRVLDSMFDIGKETIQDAASGLQRSSALDLWMRRKDRALARSRRNSAAGRRQRKHGGRR